MAINLEKGQRINLEKSNGSRLKQFNVGCNWGAIVETKGGFLGFGAKKETVDIDLDLSCLILDAQGKMLDHIYSPQYREDFLSKYNMPPGKLDSLDGALHHSGDDRQGDQDGDDGLDNEIITVNLDKVDPRAEQIFFFLNNVGPEDFAHIPYSSIRMYEGAADKPGEVFAAYDVSAEPQFGGQRALIMGKLYKRNGAWRFAAIGDACPDSNICETIQRILKDYSK